MAKYILTNEAVQDLSEIWNYTVASWSEKQADKYYRELIDCCVEIAQNPARGKKYSEVADSILGLKLNKHIIFYRLLSAEEIEVVRILHESMDLKRRSHW